jgi:hypothetical protein
LLRQALPIETGKINRIDEERWEAAIADRIRYDLASEWKEKARAFDHHDSLDGVGRYVLDPENAGIFEIEPEDSFRTLSSLTNERHFNLEILFCERTCVHIDRDIDIRRPVLLTEGTWRIRVFEGQILNILPER